MKRSNLVLLAFGLTSVFAVILTVILLAIPDKGKVAAYPAWTDRLPEYIGTTLDGKTITLDLLLAYNKARFPRAQQALTGGAADVEGVVHSLMGTRSSADWKDEAARKDELRSRINGALGEETFQDVAFTKLIIE